MEEGRVVEDPIEAEEAEDREDALTGGRDRAKIDDLDIAYLMDFNCYDER